MVCARIGPYIRAITAMFAEFNIVDGKLAAFDKHHDKFVRWPIWRPVRSGSLVPYDRVGVPKSG